VGSQVSALNKLSKALYTAARVSRDVNAVTRGPEAVAKRVVRKGAGRVVNGGLQRLLNKLMGQ
jgi:hypothetical protein